MLKAKTRWLIKSADEQKVTELAGAMKVSNTIARLLVTRGLETKEAAELFLNQDHQTFHDPFLMDEMDKAINRINKAIETEEKILVFGDYDADGVTSTTVMMRALQAKGANAQFYIPNRFTEGYGPNESAFTWASDHGFTLIITVDTGISAQHEAALARQLGMDLIITDHHEIPPDMPEAFAIIHPRKPGGRYPFGELAGVGVAFKVAHALLGELPRHLLPFVVIGTIADLVPLHGENRLIALQGLKALQHVSNVGLQALIKVCGIEDDKIDEETVGFMIGPRINAAGRIGSAAPAVQLFLTEDQVEAEQLAAEIDQLNRQRQELVSVMAEEAIAEVEANYPPEDNHVLVIARENWNAGVIGIVASRLVDKYYRPAIVLSIDSDKGEAKGSARSIDGFDLYENLSACRDILPRFGGHQMAAGMTLDCANIDELRERLNEQAKAKLSPEQLMPKQEIDIICKLDEIKTEFIEQISLLAPFGAANPKPLAMIENEPFSQMKRIGRDGSHLKITFGENGTSLDSVGFGHGDLVDEVAPMSKMSAIGELSINEWNGYRKPQLMLKDVAVHDWQLFDYRGSSNLAKRLAKLPKDCLMICFQAETKEKLGLQTAKVTHVDGISEIPPHESIVFLDLPGRKQEIEAVLASHFPNRIYAIFDHDGADFFSTLPTREHFKWYYGFLLKQKTFDVRKYADQISSRKGWSKETIHFMSKVFFELEFVKMENGVISIVTNPAKKDITDSVTYQAKKSKIEIEQDLLYSSYQELREWFLQLSAVKIEEEVMS